MMNCYLSLVNPVLFQGERMKNYFLCLLIFLSSFFCAGTKPDITPSELPKINLITQISSVSPAENAENVPINLDTIKIHFKRVDSVVLPGRIRLYGYKNTGIDSVFCEIIPGNGIIRLIPKAELSPNTQYSVLLMNPLYLDKAGKLIKMAGAKKCNFTTEKK
jgi:hypothetical protein